MVKTLEKSSPEPVDKFKQNLAGSFVDYSGTIHTLIMTYKWQKPLKIFSRTRRPMTLKLGMKHQEEELYKVYLSAKETGKKIETHFLEEDHFDGF